MSMAVDSKPEYEHPKALSTAIIGAGAAGLYLGRRLAQAGIAIELFEKSGDISGRLATRTRGNRRWNHGARKARVSQPQALPLRAMQPLLENRADDSLGTAAAREWLRPLSLGLPLRFETQVTRIARHSTGGWMVHGELPGSRTFAAGPYEQVLCTIPAPQLERLLERSELVLPEGLDQARMVPQWALLVAFAEPVVRTPEPLDLPLATLQPGVTADGGPDSLSECWVAQASPSWSEERLEVSAETAARELYPRVEALLRDPAGGRLPELAVLTAHRWRYGQVATPAPLAARFDPVLQIGFAGDWCEGPTVGDALLSAERLAEAVLEGQAAS